MYLVYCKLTKEGFKLVRSDPSKKFIKDNDTEADVEEDSDINPKIIEPLYGVELMTNPLQVHIFFPICRIRHFR